VVDFRPFRAIRYDTAEAGRMDDLICPPYDVINPSQERALRARNPHNMVRLELAEIQGAPSPTRYADASATFQRWQASGVLRRDERPAYYLVRQRFTHEGATRDRFAIFGALRLEELGNEVLPHEHTAAGPKQDRLALMEVCKANFSPIMMLFRDAGRQVAALRERVTARHPEQTFTGDDGQGYAAWRIDDPADTSVVRQALAGQKAYIADGHHRYETALTYRDAHAADGEAAGFVMTCLIDFDDPGLLILPYHRVLRGLSDAQFEYLRDRIAQIFLTEKAGVDLTSHRPLEAIVAKVGERGPAFGLVGQGGEGPYLLTVGNAALIDKYAPRGPENAVKDVEAWILQEVLLRPVLGDDFPSFVTYVHDGAEALSLVKDGTGQMAFFLKGVPPDIFETVVGMGVRLPRKSTYFHPKLPSGVVINSLSGSL